MIKRIDVAVGIVVDHDQRILIGQRVVEDLYFKKWEFPGGKFEAGETVEQALKREFYEETGLVIDQSEPFMLIEHDYPDRQVRLHIRLIRAFTGELKAMEGQALKWSEVDELSSVDFLDGNKPILKKLKQTLT